VRGTSNSTAGAGGRGQAWLQPGRRALSYGCGRRVPHSRGRGSGATHDATAEGQNSTLHAAVPQLAVHHEFAMRVTGQDGGALGSWWRSSAAGRPDRTSR
jgi:hypothetical protein